jgi:ABC-type polysaccharide/polyol phosphate export permease
MIKSLRRDLGQIHPIVALCAVDVWGYLAWQDIRLRYRRSTIGPLWITLSMLVFCLSLGFVYSRLFKQNVIEYLPFVSVGFVIWGLIASILSEMPNLYVESASYIKDTNVNPMVILMRAVARHVITFAHNMLIVGAIYLWFGMKVTASHLYVVPALLLTIVTVAAMGVTLSIVGARFRDVAPVTQSIIQIFFFVTPVTWNPSMLPAESRILTLNPFSHLLNITRSPLLGLVPDARSWVTASAVAATAVAVAIVVYRAKARDLPFWI